MLARMYLSTNARQSEEDQVCCRSKKLVVNVHLINEVATVDTAQSGHGEVSNWHVIADILVSLVKYVHLRLYMFSGNRETKRDHERLGDGYEQIYYYFVYTIQYNTIVVGLVPNLQRKRNG